MKNPEIIIKYVTGNGSNRMCKSNSEKAKELHTCPFREEIDEDYTTLCDCSETQTHDCNMNI